MEKKAHFLSEKEIKFSDKKNGQLVELKKLMFLEVGTNEILTFFVSKEKYGNLPVLLSPKYSKSGEIEQIYPYVLNLKTVVLGQNTFKLSLDSVLEL